MKTALSCLLVGMILLAIVASCGREGGSDEPDGSQNNDSGGRQPSSEVRLVAISHEKEPEPVLVDGVHVGDTPCSVSLKGGEILSVGYLYYIYSGGDSLTFSEKDDQFLVNGSVFGIRAYESRPLPDGLKKGDITYVWLMGQLTSEVAAKLAELPSMKALWAGFSKAPMEDDNIVHLKAFPNLRALNISYAQASNEGLTHLKCLRELRLLHLYMAYGIDDASLEQLKCFGNLATLNLYSTNVSDKGLAHLKKLTKLRTLDLRGTRVGSHGVEDIQKAIPDCDISK